MQWKTPLHNLQLKFFDCTSIIDRRQWFKYLVLNTNLLITICLSFSQLFGFGFQSNQMINRMQLVGTSVLQGATSQSSYLGNPTSLGRTGCQTIWLTNTMNIQIGFVHLCMCGVPPKFIRLAVSVANSFLQISKVSIDGQLL